MTVAATLPQTTEATATPKVQPTHLTAVPTLVASMIDRVPTDMDSDEYTAINWLDDLICILESVIDNNDPTSKIAQTAGWRFDHELAIDDNTAAVLGWLAALSGALEHPDELIHVLRIFHARMCHFLLADGPLPSEMGDHSPLYDRRIRVAEMLDAALHSNRPIFSVEWHSSVAPHGGLDAPPVMKHADDGRCTIDGSVVMRLDRLTSFAVADVYHERHNERTIYLLALDSIPADAPATGATVELAPPRLYTQADLDGAYQDGRAAATEEIISEARQAQANQPQSALQKQPFEYVDMCNQADALLLGLRAASERKATLLERIASELIQTDDPDSYRVGMLLEFHKLRGLDDAALGKLLREAVDHYYTELAASLPDEVIPNSHSTLASQA